MKRINLLVTIFVVAFGGFIGFNPDSPNQTTKATDVFMPRYIDVPRTGKELSLTIDLKSETVTLGENSKDATVTINKDVEIRPVYLTQKIKTERIVYMEDKTRVNRMFNKYAPLKLPNLVSTISNSKGIVNATTLH